MATEPNKIAYGGDMMLFLADDPIAFSTSAKLEITTDTREISSKDSGYWKERLAGKHDWKAGSDALYTEVLAGTATTTSVDELYALMIARTSLTVVFGAATGAAGAQTVDGTKKKFTGQAFITAISVNAPDNETTTYSISLEGTGALTQSAGVPTAPTITEANVITEDSLQIVFSLVMIDPSAFAADFTVKINGTPGSVTTVELNAFDVAIVYTVTVSDIISPGDVILLSIASGNIESVSGGTLATVTDLAVINAL